MTRENVTSLTPWNHSISFIKVHNLFIVVIVNVLTVLEEPQKKRTPCMCEHKADSDPYLSRQMHSNTHRVCWEAVAVKYYLSLFDQYELLLSASSLTSVYNEQGSMKNPLEASRWGGPPFHRCNWVNPLQAWTGFSLILLCTWKHPVFHNHTA